MYRENDVTDALNHDQVKLIRPDLYEVWDMPDDTFAIVFMDGDRVVRIEPLITIVPDDESGVVGIERPTPPPPPPLPDLADDIPFDPLLNGPEPDSCPDLSYDASDEEVRRYAIAECQKLLDNSDPRVAELKAEFIDHLDAGADALAWRLALAEQRLERIIDTIAKRFRKTFQVVQR
jgi:hypothetical protein